MSRLFLIPLLLLALVPSLFNVSLLEVIKLRTFDAFVEKKEPSGFFTILNITEEDVEERGGWPFPREMLAKIHIDLINEGALGVGWVISFPQPDRFGGDEMFAEALQYNGIIAMFESPNGIYPPTTGTVILGDDTGYGSLSAGVVNNTETLQDSVTGVATAPADSDNLVRRMSLLLRTPDGFIPAFGTQVMQSLTGTDTYIIKMGDSGIEEITVQGLDPVKTDNLGRKWISWVDTPITTLDEMNVAGKFVFVGVTAQGIMPQVATPVGLLEPQYIQSALAESILIKDSPYIPDFAPIIEILYALISVLLIWAVITYMNVYIGVISALFISVGTMLLGKSLISQGLLIDFTWSLIIQFITATTSFYMRFKEQWKLRKQIKGQFSTYLSPDMVNILVKNPEMMKLGGERKEMTFLFTDIVGFTPISESYMQKNDPEGLVELVNAFLDRMTNILLQNGATIDKYMGDCIMAFWNAPIDCEDHANKAIKSALEIELLAKQLNDEYKDLPPIVFGTGINTGICICGNMGSQTRFDYSVMGDSVNLAARLEGQTRKYETPIIISEFTAEQSSYDLKLLDKIKVKGKEQEVSIYAPSFDGKVLKLGGQTT